MTGIYFADEPLRSSPRKREPRAKLCWLHDLNLDPRFAGMNGRCKFAVHSRGHQPGWIERRARSNRGNSGAERRGRKARRGSPASRAQALRRDPPAAALGLAVFRLAEFLQPHPPHRLPQSHRPGRAGHRRALSLAIPRRPDRRARAEPAGAERDHRRRHRRLGDGGKRRRHHRSRAAAGIAGRRKLRAVRRCAIRHRIPDQSGTRGAGAAPPGVADQDARAHLRPRRRADPRQPQSLRPRRRAALRPAAAERREARPDGARLHRHAPLVRARRPAALQGTRAGERQGLSGSRSRRSTACTPAWCGSTTAAR